MPLPVVHLAIAFAAYERLDAWPTPGFLLGSLAPDAIHMRPGAGREDKRRTHLQDIPEAKRRQAVRALLARWPRDEPAVREFLRGYAAHLLADHLWARTVVHGFRDTVPGDLDDGALRALYYRELDQIDLDLFRSEPWRPAAWQMLAAARAADVPELLTAEEVDRWRRRTLAWFDDPAHDPGIVPKYITETRVRAFAQEATDLVVQAARTWQEW